MIDWTTEYQIFYWVEDLEHLTGLKHKELVTLRDVFKLLNNRDISLLINNRHKYIGIDTVKGNFRQR